MKFSLNVEHLLLSTSESQIKIKDGDWIAADPIPNSILVNTGDLLEFWTNKYYRATVNIVSIICLILNDNVWDLLIIFEASSCCRTKDDRGT